MGADYYDREAARLVEDNAQRYPDLLTEQLASAMRDASEAQRSWAQMKLVAIVAMRLASRADVKPKGDEVHLAEIAKAWASGHPVTHGGNGWLDPQMVLADLERSPEDPEALIPDVALDAAREAYERSKVGLPGGWPKPVSEMLVDVVTAAWTHFALPGPPPNPFPQSGPPCRAGRTTSPPRRVRTAGGSTRRGNSMPDEATTDELTACVLHTGCLDRDGYGRVSRGYAHRAAWEAVNGPVPPRLDLHHVCENPACVNATHLEPMTHKQHLALHALSRTHCPHGHLLDAENTYVRPNGARCCRACHRATQARYRKGKAS